MSSNESIHYLLTFLILSSYYLLFFIPYSLSLFVSFFLPPFFFILFYLRSNCPAQKHVGEAISPFVLNSTLSSCTSFIHLELLFIRLALQSFVLDLNESELGVVRLCCMGETECGIAFFPNFRRAKMKSIALR